MTSYYDAQVVVPYDGGGGEVHNILSERACATHMGGFFGLKVSKQGPLSRQFVLKHEWVIQKLAKNSHKWVVFCQNSS